LGGIFFIGGAVGYIVADMQMIGSPIWQIILTAAGIGSAASSLGYGIGYLIGLGPDQISYRREQRKIARELRLKEKGENKSSDGRKLDELERQPQKEESETARMIRRNVIQAEAKTNLANYLKSLSVNHVVTVYSLADTHSVNTKTIENIVMELIDEGEISAEFNAFKSIVRTTEKKLVEFSEKNEHYR